MKGVRTTKYERSQLGWREKNGGDGNEGEGGEKEKKMKKAVSLQFVMQSDSSSTTVGMSLAGVSLKIR